MESTKKLEARGWNYYHLLCTDQYLRWFEGEVVHKGLGEMTEHRCRCSSDGTADGQHLHNHVIVKCSMKQQAILMRYRRWLEGAQKEKDGHSMVKKIVCDLHLVNTMHYVRCTKGHGEHKHFDFYGGRPHKDTCKAAKNTLRIAFGVEKGSHADCPCTKTFDAWIGKMKKFRAKKRESAEEARRAEFTKNALGLLPCTSGLMRTPPFALARKIDPKWL